MDSLTKARIVEAAKMAGLPLRPCSEIANLPLKYHEGIWTPYAPVFAACVAIAGRAIRNPDDFLRFTDIVSRLLCATVLPDDFDPANPPEPDFYIFFS